MDDFVAILKTEYSTAFDEHRKKAMINSFYKYGPAKKNYGEYKCMDALKNIELRLQKYKDTGNTEFLVDIANFAMLEFMHPSIPGAKFIPTSTDACDVAGFGVNQLYVEHVLAIQSLYLSPHLILVYYITQRRTHVKSQLHSGP